MGAPAPTEDKERSSPPARRRRTLAIAVTIVLVVGLLGVGVARARHPSGPPYLTTRGSLQTRSMWKRGTPPDAAQRQAQDALVHATRAAMRAIPDTAAARRAGWTVGSHITVGGDGLEHWINPTYIDDGRVLDPAKPEALVVRPSTGDVVGAMFMSYGRTPQPGPQARWHRHKVGRTVCYPVTGAALAIVDAASDDGRGTDFATTSPCDPGFRKESTTPFMLHVWLVKNLGGPFDDDMDYQGDETGARLP